MKKVLVSSPPPTANGDLHVGHLSGPFLRADILTRYLKMRDVEVYNLCGTDEHQSYVAYRAEQLGLTPTETVDRFSDAIRRTLDAARIEVDVYLRPSQSTSHVRLTQGIFASLYANGTFITKEAPALYCENCDQYLFEVYVCGGCPHCGKSTCGNNCEGCGKPNDCTDLINPLCNRCKAKPVIRSSNRLYFPLSAYEQQLRAYYESVEMNSHLRTSLEEVLENGLPDLKITAIAQDATGFLWIGTPNGLSRYDGTEFRNFFHSKKPNSLPGNEIFRILNYDSNHLVIATGTGLSLLNTSTLQFKNFLVESLQQVNSLQADADQAVESMMTGGDVNPAQVLTAVQKADLTFRLMMQIRNKLVSAYQEVKDVRI